MRHDPRKNVSIARRLLGWVIPTSLAAVVAAAAFLYVATRRQILDDARADVGRMAAMAAAGAGSFAARVSNDLDLLAGSPAIADYYRNVEFGLDEEAGASRRVLIHRFRAFVRRNKIYRSILFLDAAGADVAAVSSESAADAGDAVDAAVREAFAGVRASGDAPVRPVFLRTSPPGLLAGTPVFDEHGGFHGALFAVADLGGLARRLEGLRPGRNGRTQLLDARGTPVLGEDPEDGRDSIVQESPVEDTPWRVRSIAHASEFLEPVRRFRLLAGTLVLVLGVGLGAFLYWRIHLVLAPVRGLVKATRRFGAGNLAARAPVESDDEIGRLAEDFNTMAGHLEERTRALEDRLNEIESLHRMSQAVIRRLDEGAIVRACLEAAVRGAGFERGTLYLVDRNGGVIRGAATFNTARAGFTDREILRREVPLGGGDILAQAAREGRAVRVDDPASDPRCDPSFVRESGTRGFCIAPITHQDEVLGLIGADNLDSGGPVREEQMRSLSLFCNAAGLALRNHLLFDDVLRSEARYRSVVDSSLDAIIGLDAALKVNVWSRGAEAMFGYRTEEVVGKPIRHLFLDGSYDKVVHEARRRGVVRNFNLRGRTRGGAALDLDMTWAGSDATGGLREWALVIRDVTAQKALRKQLIETEKLSLIGQLVSGVAHELNNPLASVVGYAEILTQVDGKDLPPGVADDLRAIGQSAAQCHAIVNSLLTFARRGSGEKGPVSVRSVVSSALALLEYGLRKRDDVKVETAFEPRLPKILANRSQIEQVVINLVQNALNAMERGCRVKRLRIEARGTEDGVAVVVRDTGPGVPPGSREKIFEPFYTTRKSGTGLGLAICRNIVEDHGGTLACAEDAGGWGGGFRFEIPRAATAPPARRRAEVPPPASGARILVVEDEEGLLRLVGRILRADGARVVAVPRGEDAFGALEAGVYDAVVADVHLGGISGREVCARAAALADPPALVALTGDLLSDEDRAFFRSLDVEIVSKPFSSERLLNAVRERLRARRA